MKPTSCYLITRYTTANKVYQNHAVNDNGKPLCGVNNRKQYLALEYNYDNKLGNEVSCKRCLKLLNKEQTGIELTFKPEIEKEYFV